MPNPAKRFKKTESSNPCLNIIKANIKRRMLKKPEETKEQKKSRKQQTRLEKARRKNLFKNNVLLCILEFVTNEREIGILFDDQLHSGQRKTIHDIVEKIRNAEAPENKHTRGLDQALLSNVARKNRYMLQTQSEGVMPKRRLCLFKEAPKSMYLVTHYMLNDRKTDYVKLEEDQNVSQAKKYKQIGLARKQRLIDAKQRKKAKQLRKALKRAQKVNADKVEVEINIDEYKFVKDEFDNYVARKITDIQKSDAKESESNKIKQNIDKFDAKQSKADEIKQNSDMDQPMSDYDEDMLEDYFKSSDEDVEMTKPESHDELKAIFRIEDKKYKVQTAAQNINVKKSNETKLDVDNNNKLKKVEEKYVIKTRKDFLRHNLNKCFAEFLNGEAFIEFKFLGQFDTEEYEVMNEFLNDFFMAKSSNKVTNEEFSDIWKSGDWNLGYKRDLNGGLMIYKVTHKTE
ncbi:uncharacterized protein LOC114357950 [Ostrinia furnacalis]|uniref:uncharacterized protein LOC114357950 n=1 Tax=Ostrinia furnacalis TaxID=93504 RepID=UPI00103D5A0A|nr:uncharacterized protein LOC114357950 [Ostrinia furnacalis]